MAAFAPAPRSSTADHVFRQLGAALLKGDLPAGQKLPPERVLAEQFGTSRIIVRQALHQLAGLGLVSVRQGSGATALDPNELDLRLFEVLHLAGADSAMARDLARDREEYTLLQGVMLLEAAHRRATASQRASLVELAKTADDADLDEQFWDAVTAMGANRLLEMERAFWDRVGGGESQPATEQLRKFYVALAELLVAKRDPLPLYRKVLG